MQYFETNFGVLAKAVWEWNANDSFSQEMLLTIEG